MRARRYGLHVAMVSLAVAAMAIALTPAVAGPLDAVDEYPQVAFLARNDVPFDAQTAASMAAQLGAPLFITSPTSLGDAARDGIADLDPEVLIVAGGVFAISETVAAEAAEACDPDCTIDRRFGTGRDETAAELATIRDDYGFDRPVLQGTNQVVGDVHVGGTASVDDLTIQDTEMVPGLNADRVDGMHAADLAPMWAHIDDDGQILAQSGGISVVYVADGFGITVVSLPASTWNAPISVSLSGVGSQVEGEIVVTPCGGPPQGEDCGQGPNSRNELQINTFDSSGAPSDHSFFVRVGG